MHKLTPPSPVNFSPILKVLLLYFPGKNLVIKVEYHLLCPDSENSYIWIPQYDFGQIHACA